MRNIVVALFALILCSCGGGSILTQPQDTNPAGLWLAVGGGSWTITGNGNPYTVDFTEAGLKDLQLTMAGSDFTMNGSETDLTRHMRIDYLVTGSIEADAMTGNWRITETDLNDGTVNVEDDPFTANRS